MAESYFVLVHVRSEWSLMSSYNVTETCICSYCFPDKEEDLWQVDRSNLTFESEVSHSTLPLPHVRVHNSIPDLDQPMSR